VTPILRGYLVAINFAVGRQGQSAACAHEHRSSVKQARTIWAFAKQLCM
jgi:hypothetical protein